MAQLNLLQFRRKLNLPLSRYMIYFNVLECFFANVNYFVPVMNIDKLFMINRLGAGKIPFLVFVAVAK